LRGKAKFNDLADLLIYSAYLGNKFNTKIPLSGPLKFNRLTLEMGAVITGIGLLNLNPEDWR
jgi:hypothetical protein